jgi:GMP synthase-like glutamine amidotransferase
MQHQVWIVDFGSQYTQLITRRSRELGFSSVIKTLDDVILKLKENKNMPQAIVLSGGPHQSLKIKLITHQSLTLNFPFWAFVMGCKLSLSFLEEKWNVE